MTRSTAQKAATVAFRTGGKGGSVNRMRSRRDTSVRRERVATKFSECPQCVFYCARRVNPACNSCDVGDNFEEKVRGLNPDRDNGFDGTDGRGDED